MSVNFGIYWASGTEAYSRFSEPINSDDPNELFETGTRQINQLFPDYISDDEKFKQIHQKMFADGPKLKFVRSDSYIGPLFGYIFQIGSKGLGYYIDPLVMRHVYYKRS